MKKNIFIKINKIKIIIISEIYIMHKYNNKYFLFLFLLLFLVFIYIFRKIIKNIHM